MIRSMQARTAGKQLESYDLSCGLKRRHLSQDGELLHLLIHSSLKSPWFKGDTCPLILTAFSHQTHKRRIKLVLDFFSKLICWSSVAKASWAAAILLLWWALGVTHLLNFTNEVHERALPSKWLTAWFGYDQVMVVSGLISNTMWNSGIWKRQLKWMQKKNHFVGMMVFWKEGRMEKSAEDPQGT